jgi:ribosomal protein S18 acetylase RimI-like enzyme
MDEITGLERAAAAHWRGTDEEWLGDWLLRAAEGFTGRANSVLPLGDPGVPLDDALDKVTGWYQARRLPALISVPMPLEGTSALDGELAGRGWGLRSGPAFVMTADLPRPEEPAPDGELRVDETPDAEWLRAQRYRGQSDLPPVRLKVLTSARSQAFVSIRDGQAALAVARLSVAEGWAGISSVEVDQAHRRRGLGAAITAACCAEAFRRGVNRVFLQVETGNDAAKALYARCGFTYSHRYHYRIEPGTAAF